MFTILMAALVAQAASAPTPVADVRQVSVTERKVIVEIDTNKVQGTPVGLALRTDGTIYLRIQGKDKARHYQIVTVPRASVGQVDDLPQWAATYWSWKSAIVAPGDPTLKLEVEQRSVRTQSVGGNSGGELAGMTSQALAGGSGGEGMSGAAAINAINTSMAGQVVTLRFKGTVVGEWVNESPQPGMRIGWAPAPMTLLAYCDEQGRLTVVDRDGRKLPVTGTKNALLPAWSTDGRQLVFLQKQSNTRYSLVVATLR